MVKSSEKRLPKQYHSLDEVMLYIHWRYFLLILVLFNCFLWILPWNLISLTACILNTVFIIGCHLIYDKIKFSYDKDILKHLIQHELGAGKYAARMYLHGYLKKILPVSECQCLPELAERIRLYKEVEKINIPFEKLLILCPMSGKDEPIVGKGSGIINKRKDLRPLELQRAGETRCYNNSVYKVYLDENSCGPGSHVSVVAEYASPLPTLRSLYETSVSIDETVMKTILDTFFQELSMLLEQNRDCGKYCELIRYDDDIEDGATALRKRVLELLTDKKLNYTTKIEKPVVNSEHSLENDQGRTVRCSQPSASHFR